MGNRIEGGLKFMGCLNNISPEADDSKAIIYDATLQAEPFVKGDKRVSALRVTITTCLV